MSVQHFTNFHYYYSAFIHTCHWISLATLLTCDISSRQHPWHAVAAVQGTTKGSDNGSDLLPCTHGGAPCQAGRSGHGAQHNAQCVLQMPARPCFPQGGPGVCLCWSAHHLHHGYLCKVRSWWGAGIAQWLERWTHDRKVTGLNPCWSGGRIFFSRVNFLCWLLFQYLFHPRVTAVARKRPLSFCQKRMWQVTAKHAYTLRMWLCMKWHGAWLYGVHRTRRDGCSFLWHQPCQCCKYTTSVDIFY